MIPPGYQAHWIAREGVPDGAPSSLEKGGMIEN